MCHVILIVALFVPQAVQSQSLADVARAAETQRRDTAQPAKIYTNSDVHQRDLPVIDTLADKPDVVPPSLSESAKTKTEQKSPVAALDDRLAAVRKAADEAFANRDRYAAACAGKVTTNLPAQGPGVPLDGLVIGGSDALAAQGILLPPGTGPGPTETRNETTPQCLILRQDITAQEATIKRDLDGIEETGRRSGILPGVIRDLLSKHGFK
jgi:hypothetical protein